MKEYVILDDGEYVVAAFKGDPCECLQIADSLIRKAMHAMHQQGHTCRTTGRMTEDGAVCTIQEQGGDRQKQETRSTRVPGLVRMLSTLLQEEIKNRGLAIVQGERPEQSPRQSDKCLVGRNKGVSNA